MIAVGAYNRRKCLAALPVRLCRSVKNGCMGSDVERVCGRVLLCAGCAWCVDVFVWPLRLLLSSADVTGVVESRRAVREELLATDFDSTTWLHKSAATTGAGSGVGVWE